MGEEWAVREMGQGPGETEGKRNWERRAEDGVGQPATAAWLGAGDTMDPKILETTPLAF